MPKNHIAPLFLAYSNFRGRRNNFRLCRGNFAPCFRKRKKNEKGFFFKQHLALLGANVIFGLNAPIAKSVLSDPGTGLKMGFIILLGTFLAYMLIPFGQKKIRPTLVSMYL